MTTSSRRWIQLAAATAERILKEGSKPLLIFPCFTGIFIQLVDDAQEQGFAGA